MLPPDLPGEMYDHVLKELPIEDLASVSLLNHTWQTHAFPHLYKAPCLCVEEHLKQFAERLSKDDGHGPLSIAANMKILILYHEFMTMGVDSQGRKAIDQGSLEYLKAIIPRVPRLQRISWQIGLLPEDLDILPLFQRHPSINSVNLYISNHMDDSCDTDQYWALFNFTGLTHISMHHGNLPTSFSRNQIAHLGSMLVACPDLVSLKLHFYLDESPFGQPTFPPDALVASLGDHFTFRSLRTFHFRGDLRFDWDNFFANPSSPLIPLRAFFARHQGIQDLVLQSDYFRLNHGEIHPDDLSHLFPSLKHFEGPAFLCKPLVNSPLAGQLETLVITDRFLHGAGLQEIAEGAKPLPRLRQLTVLAYSNGQAVLRVAALKALLQASILLEMLETKAELDDYPLFIELIKRLPNLRTIELNESILFQAGKHENGGEELEWEAFVPKLARIAPSLGRVYDAMGETGERIWGISRGTGVDGNINVRRIGESNRDVGRRVYA